MVRLEGFEPSPEDQILNLARTASFAIAAYKLGTPALPILQAGQLPFRTTISETLGRNKEVVAILLIVLLPLCTYWCRKAESNSYCAHTTHLHPALVMTKDSL